MTPQAERQHRLRAEGRCTSCAVLLTEHDKGRWRCAMCNITKRQAGRLRHALLVSRGLCSRCEKVKPENGLKTCPSCLAKARVAAAMRKGQECTYQNKMTEGGSR